MAVSFGETQPVFVLADKEMTIRIIRNLIRNCIQYSDGDIEIQVLVEKAAVIYFKNVVKNPSEIDVKQLFDRFYTLDRARSKPSSTGLGLSIVRLMAEQMAGSAEVSLQEGVLEIRVELPLLESYDQRKQYLYESAVPNDKV